MVIKILLKELLINIKIIIKNKILFLNKLHFFKNLDFLKSLKSQIQSFINIHEFKSHELIIRGNRFQNNLQQKQKSDFLTFKQVYQLKCSPLFNYPIRGFYE